MKQQVLKRLIKGLSWGCSNSLIVVGKAGIGKTTTTLKTLTELNMTEEESYLYFNNYITPLEFYKLLFKVNTLTTPKLLILDDIEETLKNQRILGLLKGALWEAGGKRKVSWLSSTSKSDIDSFNFEGKIIFILNYIQLKNPFVKAIIDRSLMFEMTMSREEIISLMEKEIEKKYFRLTYNQRKKVLDFIKENISTERLSLRTLPHLYNLMLTSPNHFGEMAKQLYH